MKKPAHLKKTAFLLAFVLLFTSILAGCGSTSSGETKSVPSSPEKGLSSSAGSDTSGGTEGSGDLVILYTNDVHCGVDEKIGYAGLMAYRKELEAAGKTVLLVDCGDSIQGGIIGTLTKGEGIIRLMNSVGYDAAIPGNHEFDYTVPRFLELVEKADFPYLCCNFREKESGKLLLAPYIIKEAAGQRIAFVGVDTPTTLTASTPTFFVNEEGEFVYDFCQDADGMALCKAVQEAVDSARKEGADTCILLAHLGVKESYSPYMVSRVIAGTNGIDVVLDGHSHTVSESETLQNKDGKPVLYSQTGTKLENIGELTLSADGSAKTRLISSYEQKDESISNLILEIMSEYEDILKAAVGKTDYALAVTDENGNRIVRNAETNLADLVTDAIRKATGAEIAVVNGGDIRAEIPAGDINYAHILNVHPFVTDLVSLKATGQAIADALECSVSREPEEFGGFLQVSGLSFKVDLGIPSGVVFDVNGLMTKITGTRRVRDILVNGEPLDPERVYTVGGTSYCLVEGGDGNTAFLDATDVTTFPVSDTDALVTFIKENLNGTVPDTYADRFGEGRITLLSEESSTGSGEATGDLSRDGYSLLQVVVLSRHNIRSPLSGKDSLLGTVTPHTWFAWSSNASELSLRGGVLETEMGQYFRKWLEKEGLFPDNYHPEEGAVRIYANNKQRTIATAQYFSSGILPTAKTWVETQGEYDTMNPVFNPQLTFVSPEYNADATKQIFELYKDAVDGLADNYELLADVIDLEESPAFKDGSISAFRTDDSELVLEAFKEPGVKGSLKTACSISDALVLQYYEEADALKAAFGKELTFEQWKQLSEIKDTYGDVLFTAPLVAANVAHPLLQEIEYELTANGREFSFLCGHDSNIGSVLAALGVEEYTLPGAIEAKTPIGCKFVISRWANENGEEFFSTDLVYQTTEQLRNMPLLDLANKPAVVPLSFTGIRANQDGLYAKQDFMSLLESSIAEYDRIVADYALDAAA